MKSLILSFALMTIGTAAHPFVGPGFVPFAPADLRSCHAKGWDLTRISAAESMSFIKMDDDCVAKFQIKPDDDQIHNGWRAELEDPLRLKPRSKATYEFSTLLPNSLNDKGIPSLVLAQWHDQKKPGLRALRPPLAIRLTDGRLRVTLFNQKIIDRQGVNGSGKILASEPAVFNRWIQWKVSVYWALTNQGIVEVYMNGKQIAQYVGPIGYPDDITGPYFKLGIYTTKPFNKTLEVYHTGYRRTYGEYFECDNEHKPRGNGRYTCPNHNK